ncbi:unnamed protein product [Eruca vesicaria subsp. sativa]|uniref:NPH3 domain-containing protein n=1 Tax=Eruca vesicaria subsp. sativa TaxID=29727 RepID=A0ABC8J5L0_ERUVS|nr:unnamed protein product [Eruca vesicaria subsp. sativa]
MATSKEGKKAITRSSSPRSLPVKAIIRVLFTEQTKLSRHVDWSGSLTRSPTNPSGSQHYFEPPGSGARCLSKCEMNVQQAEIKRLREDAARLQSECSAMHLQVERLMEKKSGGSKGGFFRWKRLGLVPSIRGSVSVEELTNVENSQGLNLRLLGI